ncbi:MAG: hypothetical protein ACXV8Q_07750, partial [Methylobacter sp.]
MSNTSFRQGLPESRSQGRQSSDHIHVLWIPAVHAGMTRYFSKVIGDQMNKIQTCTLGELMIYQIALSIEDGILAFHGFGSPLVQLALHLAKSNHAPNLVLVAGATYGINPTPAFLTPTTNDFAMNRDAECHLTIEELFDLAASGRLGRMFLSGLQIDCWGNMNVTRLGNDDRISLKLPGGGGGCNLSADADHVTIWTAAHRTHADEHGRR